MNKKIKISGGIPLVGKVNISGSKNAALPIMAASYMAYKSKINNLPKISDVQVMEEIFNDHFMLHLLNTPNITRLYEKIRASYYLIAPQIYLMKKATIGLPGGCEINRSISHLINIIESFGFQSEIEHIYGEGCNKVINFKKIKDIEKNTVSCSILKNKKFISSVGITINSILMSFIIKETTILSPARDPEVNSLLDVVKLMGAEVVECKNKIIIKSPDIAKKFEYTLPPDRIEAGTYAIAALMTNGRILIENYPNNHLEEFNKKLINLGAKIITLDKNNISKTLFYWGEKARNNDHIICGNYPNFPTDLHPLYALLVGRLRGEFSVLDHIYDKDRFTYINFINEISGKCHLDEETLKISGVEEYISNNKTFTLPDLRAGAAILLALLSVRGENVINNAEVLSRGYENYIYKLKTLGAMIEDA